MWKYMSKSCWMESTDYRFTLINNPGSGTITGRLMFAFVVQVSIHKNDIFNYCQAKEIIYIAETLSLLT